MKQNSPTFNMNVVVQQTGIKPDTLRAWERRYGVPEPKRTSGGHRLYSQRDIDTVEWLQARLDEGLRIKRAVALWHSLIEAGQDPLESISSQNGSPQIETAVSPITGNRIEDLRQSWIAACHQFNETAADQVLTQAFALYPPETVCLQVIQQGLAAIGNQWFTGQVTVQQEHFASALAMRRLHMLLSATPRPTRRERIIVGCPPEEDHTFAPLLLSLLLRYRGWDVIYLGADVPRERFENALETIRPDLVIMSAQLLYTASTLIGIADFFKEVQVPLAFGGLIFNLIPELRLRIHGHFLGDQLEAAPQVVDNILTYSPPLPEVTQIDEQYRIALSYFRHQQSQIEGHMWQEFQDAEMPYEHFVNANMHLARNIISALTLGDMNYLGTELVWIEQLLANYQWPTSTLKRYLSAYHVAAAHYLNDRGRPVVDWLAQIIQ